MNRGAGNLLGTSLLLAGLLLTLGVILSMVLHDAGVVMLVGLLLVRCSSNDFRGCSTDSGQRQALPGRPDRHQCGLVVGCAPDGRDHPVLLLPPGTGDRRTCFLPPIRSHDRRGNRLARLATMVPV